MAVNLLAIANQMRGNLHNSPSGSRARSSDANEPGNLPSSGSIPGTNINQDAGIRSVARKGRRGDSELRRVGGEVSHVNTTEANAIDTLGPMGEAWVKSVGSGTTNPKTGLKEYGWLKNTWNKHVKPLGKNKAFMTAAGAALALTPLGLGVGVAAGLLGNSAASGTLGGTWKPSEGKWGIFGQTDKSKKRDTAKAQAAARHTQFEDFRRTHENENIAGIFTEDTEDNTDLTGDYVGSPGFNDMITTQSGLDASANDISDYTDEYDERKETELSDKLDRDLKAINITGDALNAKREGTGTGLSSGLFGMLTESQDTTSQKGFAGSGDFAADFKKKQAIKEADAQFGAADRESESLNLEKEGVLADAMSGTQDLHDDYNQTFWENMMSWDTAINS